MKKREAIYIPIEEKMKIKYLKALRKKSYKKNKNITQAEDIREYIEKVINQYED